MSLSAITSGVTCQTGNMATPVTEELEMANVREVNDAIKY